MPCLLLNSCRRSCWRRIEILYAAGEGRKSQCKVAQESEENGRRVSDVRRSRNGTLSVFTEMTAPHEKLRLMFLSRISVQLRI